MKPLSRTLAVLAAVALLTLGIVSPAAAHVTVSSTSAEPGAWVTLTFKVPNESETTRTTGLTVQLPADTPFTSVLTQATPGWTAKTVKAKLAQPLQDDDGNAITSAITSVDWTASDGGAGPGQFATFVLSVGPLPKSGTLYLPTVQHYSDGNDVDWVQQAQAGAEAEHPAPSIVIAVAEKTGPDQAPPYGWGIGLGIAGIVLALFAGAVAGVAYVRVRR